MKTEWPNCPKHGAAFMKQSTKGRDRYHVCAECNHKQHEGLCEKCFSKVEVVPESQASALLKCSNKKCRHVEVILF